LGQSWVVDLITENSLSNPFFIESIEETKQLLQREVKKYLLDIQISLNSIHEFLGDEMGFDSYKANKLLRRAVERELGIIGEATNKLLKIELSPRFVSPQTAIEACRS
jgi:hypothetical protein